MPTVLRKELVKIAKGDLFKWDAGKPTTGKFVGRPFSMSYDRAFLLVADKWKQDADGLPQGTFLLAYYENEEKIQEALLLRVLQPAKLPTDSDVISSMIEYYKDNLKTAGKETQLDTYTRYEFSFSGLECRILGTFYREKADGDVRFGADVENFYSAHNYTVVKPNAEALRFIVNFRDGSVAGKPSDIRIGRVRYSSTRRFQAQEKEEVEVFVSPQDFLGKRTALFGMTRTGKSNTVKKVIQASVRMSDKAKYKLVSPPTESEAEKAEPYTGEGLPKYPVGQIIFDINGEYANANLQDEGTAIFEMYQDRVTRYSVRQKPGFKVMRVNFYRDVQAGFEMVRSALALEGGVDYVGSFLAVDLTEPEDETDHSATTRHGRVRAAYQCCLYKAGLKAPQGFRVKFTGTKEINDQVKQGGMDPSKGLTLEEACDWFTWVWENYEKDAFFSTYRTKKGREWADEDLKAMLTFLTRKTSPGRNASVNGFLKLRPLQPLHTDTVDKPFEQDIIERLRAGQIVIVDLSQGDPEIQRLYSERICRAIFAEAMGRFIDAKPNNFLQFYFEEAHNLFPRKDDNDLSQVYNRIAKEGAKLNLGLVYATQEVSSISGNILKNTQNWFIAHLNNEDETKEIRKYYDFGDFTDGLVRFSASDDKSFVRMKTYTNPFVVPVQIDRFKKNAPDGGGS